MPSGRTLLVVGAGLALTAALAGLVLWGGSWGGGRAGSELEDDCRARNLPCPFASDVALPPELTNLENLDELAQAMPGVLAHLGRVTLPATAPDRIRTVARIAGGSDLNLTPLEVVALALRGVEAAHLEARACVVASDLDSPPFWQRLYAVCDRDCRPHYEPVAPPASAPTYQCLDDRTFAAFFIAASAQLPLPAKEAYRLFAGARELADEPELLLHLGAVKVRNDAPEFGIEDMRRALSRGAPVGGNLMLGEALLGSGLPSDALDAYEAVLKVFPDAAGARLGKARCLGLLGRTDEAAGLLEGLVRDVPDLPGLNAAVGLAHRQQGERAKAVEALRKEVSGNPTREYVALLVDLLLEGKEEGAAMELLDSLYAEHRRADLAAMAIDLSRAAGRTDEAEERLDKALEAHPDNVELLHLAARSFLDRKEYGAAEDVLMRLGQRDPENSEVMVNLALSRFGLERSGGKGSKGARETVEELARRWPREVYRLARILSEWKYWDETEKVLEDRLAERPRSRRLTGWLYFFYLAHGKPEQAAALRARPRDWQDDEARARFEEMFTELGKRAEERRREMESEEP